MKQSNGVKLSRALGNRFAWILHWFSPFYDRKSLKDQMEVVDEVARIVTSTLDINQVYEQFAGEVTRLVDFDRIVIHVIDEHAGTSILKYGWGIGPPGSDIGTVRRLQDVRSAI